MAIIEEGALSRERAMHKGLLPPIVVHWNFKPTTKTKVLSNELW